MYQTNSNNCKENNPRNVQENFKPKFLGKKLRMIRYHLDLTQAEMYLQLNPTAVSANASLISRFESGHSEPTLLETLSYARLVGITMAKLIDDRTELSPKDFSKGH